MRSLPTNAELEANYQAGKWKRFFCWHKYILGSSYMYGDATVDCVKCSETHFTCGLEVFMLRLLGKLVK